MRLLDLFCGAGGAAMGYHRASPAGGGMSDWLLLAMFLFGLVTGICAALSWRNQ